MGSYIHAGGNAVGSPSYIFNGFGSIVLAAGIYIMNIVCPPSTPMVFVKGVNFRIIA